MIEVTLDWWEVVSAAEVGVRRHVANRAKQNNHRFGKPKDLWSTDIQGALAECVLAKAIDRYWRPLVREPQTLEGDVGREQVRSTSRTNGCLILHPPDPDDARFWLVVGDVPTFRVIGWIRGVDGKQPEYWQQGDGRPAFFVPQDALTPVHDTSEAVAA